MKRIVGVVAAAAVTLFIVSGGAAAAADLITGKDIKNGSIALKDLSKGAKKSLKGQRGARGPQGLQGIPGQRGPAGPAGPDASNSVTVAFGDTQFLCADGGGDCQVGVSLAQCPAGMIAIGGGHEFENNVPVVNSVGYNSSTADGTGWLVAMVNQAAIEADFYAVANCIRGTIANAGGGMSKAEMKKQLKAAL